VRELPPLRRRRRKYERLRGAEIKIKADSISSRTITHTQSCCVRPLAREVLNIEHAAFRQPVYKGRPQAENSVVSNLKTIVKDIADEMRTRTDRGEVASYIPELARVDPKLFGIAVIDAEGNVAAGGDSDTPFSIQSVSKVFTLTLALGKAGDRLWQRVGREPSGSAFNSIVQLEYERGIPRNPFINAGAIAITDLILSGHQPREALGEILRFIQFLTQDSSIVFRTAHWIPQHRARQLHEVVWRAR